MREAFLTGGLPPLTSGPDPVYAKTYGMFTYPVSFGNFLNNDEYTEKVKLRNEAYYEKYPEDVERVKRIMLYLQQNDIRLPSGKLTPARFQQLGILFGFHGELSSEVKMK